jgi:glucarate dehydratase
VKIVEVTATPVLVPLRRPLRWSFGTETATVRTVVELRTEDGIVGVGETRGGRAVADAVRASKELYLGVDAREALRIARRYGFYRVSSEQLATVGAMKLAGAAVEMAAWDAVGKALGMRCGDLWGGIERERVEVAAYAFYRYAGERTEDAADHAVQLVEQHGFRDVKLKGGVLEPERELETVNAIRDGLGSRLRRLRLDPNQAWSVETSIRTLQQVEGDPDIEFCEDPTWGIEGMGLVRRSVNVPLATNMCCVSFEQIPPVVRARALDVILGDVHFWGGPSAVTQLAKVCETFNLGLGLHSDRELGISTAAVLHVAASQPLVHSIDSHLPEQSDDIVTAPHVFEDGHLPVPEGPGLGVELDPDRLAKYAREFERQGEEDEFRDAARRGWWPRLPLF